VIEDRRDDRELDRRLSALERACRRSPEHMRLAVKTER
jgi:hypothetical protein